MKFIVTVQRIEHRDHDFEVEADSPEEAEEIGLEESCNFDFNQASICHAGEEVISVEEVKVGFNYSE